MLSNKLLHLQITRKNFCSMVYSIEIDSHCIHAEKLIFQDSEKTALIIFLHDAWGCTAMWGDFPKTLATKLRCNALLYDRRGFGQSDMDETTNRTPDYFYRESHELIALLDVLHVKKAILFGHSDGATIALLSAALFPERIEALILESPHTFLEESGLQAVNETARKAQRTNLIQALEKYHGEKAQALFDKWKNCWGSEAFTGWNLLPLLEKIKCPTLAFRGKNDIFDSHEQLHQLKTHFQSNIEIAIIPNSTHSPHREATNTTLKVCISWFKRKK